MNPINLREMALRQNPRRKVIRLRPIEPTQSQATDLAAIYMRTVRIWESARPEIMQAYAREMAVIGDSLTRDETGWLSAVIQAISGQVTAEMTFFDALFGAWSDSVVRWHTRRIVGNLKYASNVDLGDYLTAGDVVETVEAALARNAALVRDVSDQTRARISDIVYRGLQVRTPSRDVAKQISEATGLSRKRAGRIASDQANKLSAALDRQRLRQLGFDGIVWKHSHKRNYRPEHLARDGDFFPWDSPIMKSDPPGHAPFCGCMSIGSMSLAD